MEYTQVILPLEIDLFGYRADFFHRVASGALIPRDPSDVVFEPINPLRADNKNSLVYESELKRRKNARRLATIELEEDTIAYIAEILRSEKQATEHTQVANGIVTYFEQYMSAHRTKRQQRRSNIATGYTLLLHGSEYEPSSLTDDLFDRELAEFDEYSKGYLFYTSGA